MITQPPHQDVSLLYLQSVATPSVEIHHVRDFVWYLAWSMMSVGIQSCMVIKYSYSPFLYYYMYMYMYV